MADIFPEKDGLNTMQNVAGLDQVNVACFHILLFYLSNTNQNY